MTISVFAPISIGNLSVGFDVLGMAVSPIDGALVGDIVTIDEAKNKTQFQVKGNYANKLPAEIRENIVWQCTQTFEEKMLQSGSSIKEINLTLHKNIPVSSGLGSSACSVVATFVALNEFYQNPFSELELIKLMGALEAKISGSLHYDNVAPCFLGGLQLMLSTQNKITQRLPIFDDCYWVIAYPDVIVSTKAAREILPQSYSRQTTIEFGQNLAGFVDACYRQDKPQAFELLKDVIAEPYRQSLLPNFNTVKSNLIDLGSLAVGISGSGPTLFSVCDDLKTAQANQEYLVSNYLQSDNGFVHICKTDNIGARKV